MAPHRSPKRYGPTGDSRFLLIKLVWAVRLARIVQSGKSSAMIADKFSD
jgi:hypothetical protein